jgi:fructuronate reductase
MTGHWAPHTLTDYGKPSRNRNRRLIRLRYGNIAGSALSNQEEDVMELRLKDMEKIRTSGQGIALPEYDVSAMVEKTRLNPTWIHFGAGNIFRGYIARLHQTLLNKGAAETGIIAAESFDYGIIEKIYQPYDNLTFLVTMKSDGTMDNEIIASIAEGIKVNDEAQNLERMSSIFESPSLQMASFTITEKGYDLWTMDGKYLPIVEADISNGPDAAKHVMSRVTALLYKRFQAGKLPIAVVSMDNCSHNGEKLEKAVLNIAEAWVRKGFVVPEFMDYLEDEKKISFPWSMIDKITPRPSASVQKEIEALGFENMGSILTDRNTFIAPFVNAELAEYLVIEDRFPNGRPRLEEAGVYFGNRDTVNKMETMKVTTCLNPLHTALAVYGRLLNHKFIYETIEDADLNKLVHNLAFRESLPVVVNPGIIEPRQFLEEVLHERLPNRNIPDMPERIATDTSQKMGIRFGETIKSYVEREDLDPKDLRYVPLVIAGWLRYLLAVNDEGESFELSSDPLLPELKAALNGISMGDTGVSSTGFKDLLKNVKIFGVDLEEVGLSEKVTAYFLQMIRGNGAVRETLSSNIE